MEQRRSAFCRYRRRPESARHDEIEGPPEGTASCFLGPGGRDRDPVREVEASNGLREPLATPNAAVEQDPGRRRPRERQGEPGDAATAAEIEGALRGKGGRREGEAAVELPFDGAGAEVSELLRAGQRVEQATTSIVAQTYRRRWRGSRRAGGVRLRRQGRRLGRQRLLSRQGRQERPWRGCRRWG